MGWMYLQSYQNSTQDGFYRFSSVPGVCASVHPHEHGLLRVPNIVLTKNDKVNIHPMSPVRYGSVSFETVSAFNA